MIIWSESPGMGAEVSCDNWMNESKCHNAFYLKKLGGRKNNRIYTYIENDAFAPSGDDLIPMTTSPDETPTYIAEQMTQLRRRKPVPSGGNVLNTKIQQ